MLIAMLENWTQKFGTMDEKLFLATALAIVGIVIVFIVLVLIIVAIFVLSRVIRIIDRRNEASGVSAFNAATASVPENDDVWTTYAEETPDQKLDIVAVIMAAIAASMSGTAEGQPTGAPYPGFRVRSIRKI